MLLLLLRNDWKRDKLQWRGEQSGSNESRLFTKVTVR